VVVLPADITPEYVFSINERPGILALALRPRASPATAVQAKPHHHHDDEDEDDQSEAASADAGGGVAAAAAVRGTSALGRSEDDVRGTTPGRSPANLAAVDPHAPLPGPLGRALALSDAQLLQQYEGVPFVVPGGRFNEMYGWDSYFEVRAIPPPPHTHTQTEREARVLVACPIGATHKERERERQNREAPRVVGADTCVQCG
jgi:hypothetical protein